MGTKADFYVGRGEDAEWLGSIAMDGYPQDDGGSGVPLPICEASDETVYRGLVGAFLRGRRDGVLPDAGWPWPWEDSRLTDYSYAFDDGTVYVSVFGHLWWPAAGPEPKDYFKGGRLDTFPNMKSRQKGDPEEERPGEQAHGHEESTARRHVLPYKGYTIIVGSVMTALRRLRAGRPVEDIEPQLLRIKRIMDRCEPLAGEKSRSRGDG